MAEAFGGLGDLGPLGRLCDPFIAAWMLSPDSPLDEFDMTALCVQHKIASPHLPGLPFVGHGVQAVGSPGGTSARVTPQQVTDHLVYLEALVDAVLKRLEMAGLDPPFWRVEMPLVPVLAEMGYEGVGFNRQASSDMTKEIEGRLRELEAQCFALAKRSFNVRSPQETAAVLYDELKLSPPETWKPSDASVGAARETKRHKSTSQDVLEAMSSQHPLPGLIATHRKLSKVLSTYTTSLGDHVVFDCVRAAVIRTSFNQCCTGTGRLSSRTCPRRRGA